MFKVTQKHIDDHENLGITILREIVPTSLIKDLRKEADKCLDLARTIHGPQAQRIQPVSDYESILDIKAFRDYLELPELNDALKQILGDDAFYDNIDLLGVLVGPPASTNCMQWHMDLSENTAGVDPSDLQRMRLTPSLGNQANCAIYDDSCLWFVPGSHKLPISEKEQKVAGSEKWDEILPVLLEPNEEIQVELERQCVDYMNSMPGAVQQHLNPGDFALYRPFAWHGAFYPSYKKRATLHHGVWNAESLAWWLEMNNRRGSWRDRYEKPVTSQEEI